MVNFKECLNLNNEVVWVFKRKHFMQTTKHDCGVACIYTLLTYYNCHVDYNKIRNYFKNDYSGINISQINDFFQLFNIKIKLYLIDHQAQGEKYNSDNSKILDNFSESIGKDFVMYFEIFSIICVPVYL